jgi:hypothetical protein
MAYITNFSFFNQEESGIPIPGKGITGFYLPGLQKSSLNTIGDFCMNPYGGVSNLDCPDWDPSCNCIVTQFMPTKPEPEQKTLITLRKKISECDLIKQYLGNDWLGIDYTNPYSTFNCPGCAYETVEPKPEERLIQAYKLKKDNESIQGYTGPYPYSLGISGISGIKLSTDYGPGEAPEKITKADWKCTGDCFKYYTEYSKTNATFWNTPLKTPLLRKGQIGSYNAQKIKILVNGDSRIHVGDLINLSIPIEGYPYKKRFSGRWMIYKIERVLTLNKHSMFLYLMRDGHSLNEVTNPLDLDVNIPNTIEG